MASPASFSGMNPIVDPVFPRKRNKEMKIQPIAPKSKLTKAQKYRGIKQTKEVDTVYKTY
jgi:hypothetical protein